MRNRRDGVILDVLQNYTCVTSNASVQEKEHVEDYYVIQQGRAVAEKLASLFYNFAVTIQG